MAKCRVRNPRTYKALRRKRYSKESAARIANWQSKRRKRKGRR